MPRLQPGRCRREGEFTPPLRGAYVALCLVAKDQHEDLPEWLAWHARLGVGRVYLLDMGSSPPLQVLCGLLSERDLCVTQSEQSI